MYYYELARNGYCYIYQQGRHDEIFARTDCPIKAQRICAALNKEFHQAAA